MIENLGIPRWLYLPAAIGAAFIAVPIIAMGVRLEWGNFFGLVAAPESRTALWLSLKTAFASTVLCVVFGVPLALVLARSRGRAGTLIRALILLPMVLPPVVGGVALLYTFGRRGLIGAQLELLGVNVAFSTAAVVMAQTFVAMPFLVVSLEGTLRTHDQRYEAVAATLGANRATVLVRVTLPLIGPGLVSAALLAFARALGEFGATITFAGSLEGVTRTLPLQIYLERVQDPQAAIALSFLLIGAAIVVSAVSGLVSTGARR